MATIRFVAAMALAVIGASGTASVAASQDTIQVGDFSVFRSFDFLTDSLTSGWARAGDELWANPFAFLRTQYGEDVDGYETLELKCEEGALQVILHFWPDQRAISPRLTPQDPARAPNPAVSGQLAPVQLRFDTNSPEPPSQWMVRFYTALMPYAEVPVFLEKARPATRLRVRVGPYSAPLSSRGTMRQEELEFSLLGFSRSLELLNCPSP